MSDEINSELTPEPPAVPLDAVSDSVTGPEGKDVPVFSPDLPPFVESAERPYAAGTPAPIRPSDEVPFEIRIQGELAALHIKLDEVLRQSANTIGRIDWIAPRIDWIQRTFQGLIDQFGKITPGQVFSMMRGKSPISQEGKSQS